MAVNEFELSEEETQKFNDTLNSSNPRMYYTKHLVFFAISL